MAENDPTIRILVVDDKPEDIEQIRASVDESAPPIEVHDAKHARDAMWALQKDEFDIVAISSHLHQSDAIALLDRIRNEGYSLPVVLLGDIDSAQGALRAVSAGAADFISKRHLGSPLLIDRLLRVIEMERLRAELVAEKARLAHEQSRARINKMKSEFLANTSHELRTPLSAILGYSEILKEELQEKINPELFDFLVRLRENAQHLLDMINTMLDYAALVTSADEVRVVDFRVDDSFAKVLQALQSQAAARGITLESEVEPEGLTVVSEPSRLQRAIYHLLDNAIKFSPEPGPISLRAWREDDRVTIEIHDRGIGIAAEDLDRIFEPFEQADGSSTRRFGGLGLGLTTAKRVLESLGGTLDVSSSKGEGSRFTAILPCRNTAVGSEN